MLHHRLFWSSLTIGCGLLTAVGCFFWMKGWLSVPSLTTDDQGNEEALLTTAFTNRSAYLRYFDEAVATPRVEQPTALITSHHFLAAPLITRSFQAVASADIERVIVVSPDHFESEFSEGTLAYTTDIHWDALFGELHADREFIRRLVDQTSWVEAKQAPFLQEHGIYTEIPFIHHSFPKAAVVPLIVKNTFKYDDFIALGERVRSLASDAVPTIVIISSDFSHHATHASAHVQDQRSLSALAHLSRERFDDLNNDCRACIAFLSGYLGAGSSFQLLENRDSTDFGGEDRDVTSYVVGYFARPSRAGTSDDVSSSAGPTLLFGGDLMFDRYIRTAMQRHGNDFPLAPLKKTLARADLVVANLEGPITREASLSEKSAMGSRENYFFTFDPAVASVLKVFNIGVVNLGNNHTLNFGEGGVKETEEFLRAAQVEYFGTPLTRTDRYLIKTIQGIKVALVNYNQFVVDGKAKALEDIATVKGKTDVIVLYTHWGKEYVEVLPSVKAIAHEFIDAGADVIIGSHPHIVQEKELYRNKTIYYSLGNFVFDQYETANTQEGLLVKITIDPATKQLSFKDIPITLEKNGQTVLASED